MYLSVTNIAKVPDIIFNDVTVFGIINFFNFSYFWSSFYKVNKNSFMFNKFLYLIIITFFCSLYSNAQILKYSNDYLTIGISARNISLGNSVVANISDFSSSYYNPAGLSGLQNKYQVSLMHSEYFAGIAKYDYAGFAYKLNDSTGVAASIIRLGVDNIQNTLYLYDENGNIDYDRIQLFSVADYALLLSWGKKSKIKNLSYGANAKFIFRNQGEFATAYGFALDAGMKYNVKKWNFGVNMTNATTGFTAWFYNISEQMKKVFEETGNELPKNNLEIAMPILNTGVGRYFKFSENMGLLGEIDVNFAFDGERNALISFNPISIYPQTGLEFNYKKTVFIRTGVNNFQLIPDFKNKTKDGEEYYNEKSFDFVPSIGLGIIFKGLYIDYALTDVANQSIALYSHIFSLGYKF